MVRPLVSVVLPVYNGEEYLADSINSVLSQTYQPIELIIVDDGSTDNSAEIAKNFSENILYFHQNNSGPAAARNLGIKKAKGKFISFIDCDDLWPENKLANQMECFKRIPSIDIVQGLIRRVNIKELDKTINQKGGIDFLFVYSNLGSMIMRRSVFEKIGLFEETLSYHEDTDLWLRAREAGLLVVVQRKESLIYQIHGRNLTTGKDIVSTNFLHIIGKSITRRRNNKDQITKIPELIFIENFITKAQKFPGSIKSKTNAWPKVSIILHSIQNKYLLENSIRSILSQEYPSIQLIVISDKSYFMPKSLIAQFHHVKYVDENPLDFGLSLNNAIHVCAGDFIAFLDANAEWVARKLSIQIPFLIQNINVGFCFGRTRHILEPDKRYSSDLIDSLAYRKSVGDQLDTLVVRQSTFEMIGEFSEGRSIFVETDWLLKAKDIGISLKIFPDVFLYRYIKNNTSYTNIKKIKSSLMDSIYSSIQRKRSEHDY